MAELTVAINAHLLYAGGNYRNAGISRYIRNLLLWLPKVAEELSVVAFVGPQAQDTQWKGLNPQVRLVPTRVPTHNPVVRILWEQLVLPWAVELRLATVFHSPLNALPWLCRTAAVVTVHDLAFELFPDTYPLLKSLYLRLSTRHGTWRARRVLAVSQATADDLIAKYGVSPDRVVVTPNGVDPSFTPQPPEARAAYSSAKGLGNYFLYLGTLQPRKNLATLLKAWEKAAARQTGFRLVIAGPPGWHSHSLMQLSENLHLADSVFFLGWVPDEEVPHLMGSAIAFLYPSLYEGFGLPVAEAMACGTPVVVSDAPALKEVAQGAGLVIPATDVESWAMAIDRLAQDQVLRQDLSARGIEKSRQYTWKRTAALTAKTYREVAGK